MAAKYSQKSCAFAATIFCMQFLRPAAALFVALMAVPASASVLYNESLSGDLSNSGSSPTPLTISPGINAVIGSVEGTGGADPQDWIALTVPSGLNLSAIVLANYSSTDLQGFFGFQSGGSFSGSVDSASNYEGYTHFGTGATNGSPPMPATNLVGADLLSIMSMPAQDPGAGGFTPPLGPGTYSFLIQQLGALTNYEFDFDTPEPSSLAAVACGMTLLRRKQFS
jgi:hypothetical protein